MRKKIFSILVLSVLALLTSCASSKNQINVAAAYPFEGRYGTEVEIRIDGKQIHYSESVWVLSNKTLYSLLTSTGAKKREPVLLENKFEAIDTVFETPSVRRDNIDDFCNETYVWESWVISTNNVGF